MESASVLQDNSQLCAFLVDNNVLYLPQSGFRPGQNYTPATAAVVDGHFDNSAYSWFKF